MVVILFIRGGVISQFRVIKWFVNLYNFLRGDLDILRLKSPHSHFAHFDKELCDAYIRDRFCLHSTDQSILLANFKLFRKFQLVLIISSKTWLRSLNCNVIPFLLFFLFLRRNTQIFSTKNDLFNLLSIWSFYKRRTLCWYFDPIYFYAAKVEYLIFLCRAFDNCSI